MHMPMMPPATFNPKRSDSETAPSLKIIIAETFKGLHRAIDACLHRRWRAVVPFIRQIWASCFAAAYVPVKRFVRRSIYSFLQGVAFLCRASNRDCKSS